MPNFAELFTGHLDVLRKATATVEWEADPAIPGRTAYRITGESAEAVQAAVDSRMSHAENNGGCAEFTHPERRGGRYQALGYVHIAAAGQAEGRP